MVKVVYKFFNDKFKLSSYLLRLGGFSLRHHVEEEGPDERTADVLPRPHPPDGEQEGDVAQQPRYKNQCPQLQRAHNGNTAPEKESAQETAVWRRSEKSGRPADSARDAFNVAIV